MARRGGFPGMMGGGNMQQLARQAQMLQQQISQLQENLDKREFEATAGGGMVRAKVNGERELLELEIKPEAVDPEDVDMLQDMIMAAINEALKTAHETVENEMGKLTGGMGGGFGGLL
ncbi:MAG: YbaB/EbfC family nucleoid-associated protein [Candidatus Fimadaptatus sp.]|jgi:DNA-binding YbaB/EbfC family protein